MKDCPVCAKAGLADELLECPQCNADLECFDLLDALHEESISIQTQIDLHNRLDRLHKRGWLQRYAVPILVVIVLGAVILYKDFTLEQRLSNEFMQALQTALTAEQDSAAQLSTDKRVINQSLRRLEEKLSDVTAKQEQAYAHLAAIAQHFEDHKSPVLAEEQQSQTPETPIAETATQDEDDSFLYHPSSQTDTLWDIAKRYYGKGHFYPVLLEYNPGLSIYYDRNYGKIKVLRDPQKAQQVLKSLVTISSKGTLFQYRVEQGDTWRHLSRRFFGHGGKTTELMTLNENIELVPGQRISIPLQ